MLHRRWGACLLVLLSSVAFAGADIESNKAGHRESSGVLPITTSSARARKQFQHAMQNLEYVRSDAAVADLRQAVKLDPRFAQAQILLSYLSKTPEEQRTSRTRAKQLTRHVSEGEQLLIRWLAGVQEDNYVPAIAAMNDLLARYPRDERIAFLAGMWLVGQERYSQAVTLLERAVKLAPDYPAALNELAYAYAFSGKFEPAFVAMKRYVALQPDQPNPYDSYGEILRLAGKFEAALEQYRMSIRVDPSFGSELGVADTLAVMGNEQEARDEYQRAAALVANETERVEHELQSAATWIREDNHKQACKALRAVAKHAHTAGLGRLEAESHRVLAVYEKDYKSAMKQVQAAEAALEHGHEMSLTDKTEEQAKILRVKAVRSAEAQSFDVASGAVKQLESMAQRSRSQVVHYSYEASAGALLLAQGKYAEAISHLEEDADNPLTMRLLWTAYSMTGATAQAEQIGAKLADLNMPTAEQAVVVPRFRSSLVSQAKQP
jgi:tetratricopeptide (TPR) repeat protein